LCIAACGALLSPAAARATPPLFPSLEPAMSLPPTRALPSWLLDGAGDGLAVAAHERGLRADVQLHRPGRSQWIFDLPDFDRAPLYLGMDVDIGTRQLGVRLDGTLRVTTDYPALGGSLHLHFNGRDIPLELPWVQMVPRRELGIFYMEVRLTLVERRF
jgi:hypothetical protein